MIKQEKTQNRIRIKEMRNKAKVHQGSLGSKELSQALQKGRIHRKEEDKGAWPMLHWQAQVGKQQPLQVALLNDS